MKRLSPRIALMPLAALVAVFLLMGSAPTALASDDVKQAGKILSAVKRHIPTSPSQAETEWLEAEAMIKNLESSQPDDPAVKKLRADLDTLGTALEKRLKRPLGGEAAPKAEAAAKPAPAPAEAGPSLPGSVISRLDRLGKELDAVDDALGKDRLQTAKTKLASAAKVMDEIQSRYGDKIPEGNPEMAAATERLASVTARVEGAASEARAQDQAEAEAKARKEAGSREWLDRFAPFFDHTSDLYLRIGSDFNGGTPEEQEVYRKAYARANDLMKEYEAAQFPDGKTQELLFMEPRIRDTLAWFNQDEARARQEEASGEWADKLAGYADVGAGSPDYLVDGITLSEPDLKQREANLKAATALWEAYSKAEFPLGKSPRLLALESELADKLKTMPEDLRKSRALLAGNLEGELDRVLDNLNRDTGWKSDESKLPNLAMKRDIDPLEKAVERYAGTVDAGDPTLAGLKKKLALIRETDKKNREVRSRRTFMAPEKYSGGDAGTLRDKVMAIAGKDGAKVLRVSLSADGWKEEDVVEWTDTTKTALRRRITRSMAVQAATRGSDGRVYLNGVHLASDRQTDGWGPLYGHVMWSDWMAEENVNK